MMNASGCKSPLLHRWTEKRVGCARSIAVDEPGDLQAKPDLDTALRSLSDQRHTDEPEHLGGEGSGPAPLVEYEAVVVDSAIYLGQWLKAARSFVDAHAGELAKRPTWLFSSGPVGGDPSRPDQHDAARGGDAPAEIVHAREHKLFAGKLD